MWVNRIGNGGAETAYRREVEKLVAWCLTNNLSLNTDKTKEMIIDPMRKKVQHTPLYMGEAEVERVKTSGAALTCCVDIQPFCTIKKISPLIFLKVGLGAGLCKLELATQAMMTFTLIFSTVYGCSFPPHALPPHALHALQHCALPPYALLHHALPPHALYFSK